MTTHDPYETITLDLTELEQEECVRAYVATNLVDAAAYTFNDLLINAGKPIQEALYQAVLNDFIHQALAEAVEKAKVTE